MARSSPEKLAAALRANLKRRKEAARDVPEPPAAPSGSESVPAQAQSPAKPAPDQGF
jgi:hypothetical protein